VEVKQQLALLQAEIQSLLPNPPPSTNDSNNPPPATQSQANLQPSPQPQEIFGTPISLIPLSKPIDNKSPLFEGYKP